LFGFTSLSRGFSYDPDWPRTSDLTSKVIVRILLNSNIKIKLDAYSHVLPIMQLESVRKISKMIFD
ncbi:hypothetical protein COK72_19255, partial [Bacillus thuringiensis]